MKAQISNYMHNKQVIAQVRGVGDISFITFRTVSKMPLNVFSTPVVQFALDNLDNSPFFASSKNVTLSLNFYISANILYKSL